MIGRILGTLAGVSLILLVLFLRGIPVLFLLKMIPLLLILFVGVAFIWAGLTSD